MQNRIGSFLLLLTLATGLLPGCTETVQRPDVSQISVSVRTMRFDRDFFALDTLALPSQLQGLARSYPDFYSEYMQFMLGVSGQPRDSLTQQTILSFLRSYRPVYDSLRSRFERTQPIEQELQQSFRYLRYYFPDYPTGTVTFFMGPFDAPGVALVRSGIAVGLQQFGGTDFFAYNTPAVLAIYPAYLSRRFAPGYMVPTVMKAITEDIFPYAAADRTLIEQMVEKGKYWYLLDLLMPDTPDSLKTGFTQAQLDWCHENEGLIWSHLLRNEDLNSLNPVVIQTYLGEAPFTQGLSQTDSPGNLGTWVGWQIVKKFVAKNPMVDPRALMQTKATTLLEQAKYKPK